MKSPLRWRDRFDIEWQDWNRMHYLLSLVAFEYTFSNEEKEFMKNNVDRYTSCRIEIQDLQDAGILVTGIPIKLHTLKQKAGVIKNISQCLGHYNQWIGVNQPSNAIAYRPEILEKAAQLEHSQWSTGETGTQLTLDDIPAQQLLLSDLKF